MPLRSSIVQRTCQKALRRCGLRKKVSAAHLAARYATHLLEAGLVDLGTLQRLLGNRDLKTTVPYTPLSVQRVQQTAGLLT